MGRDLTSDSARVLAWDTSGKQGVISTFETQVSGTLLKVASEWMLNVQATHSERLLWAIDQVLKASGWELETIDFFGLGIGPGSFTGLRIGVTTARTLAMAQNKPILPVSSLALLALPEAHRFWVTNGQVQAGCASSNDVPGLAPDPWIFATTDACKGELYGLLARASEVRSKDGSAICEAVLTPEAWNLQLHKAIGENGHWVALGAGLSTYPETIEKLPVETRIDAMPGADLPKGSWLAQLVARQILRGGAMGYGEVTPAYLRESDAQLKLTAGKLRPTGAIGGKTTR